MEQLLFHKTQVDRLFPFYILTDKSLIIQSYGHTLQKLIPNVEGQNVYDLFTASYPIIDQNINGNNITPSEQTIELCLKKNKELILKGYIEEIEGGDLLLFCISLRSDCIRKLMNKKLKLNDFSFHDSTSDIFTAVEVFQQASNDMEELLYNLNKQKNKLGKLSDIIENSINSIIITDSTGCIEWVNKSFCEITGYTIKDIIGKKPNKLLSGIDTSAETLNYLKGQIKVNKPYACEILNYRKNKTSYWVNTSGQPIFDKNGKLSQYFIIDENITHNKKSKEVLLTETDKYGNIIANMNLGLVEIDNLGKIVYTNDSLSNNLGYTSAELLSQQASLLMPAESIASFRDHVAQRAKGVSGAYELKVTHKSGKECTWLISAAPKYNDSNEVEGSIAICLDITNQKKLEHQKEDLLKSLSEQNEQLNEYAHIVAHDLKSPLRGIYALLSWTIEDFEEKLGNDGLTNLNLMQDKVEKMDHLIDNILKYSSIERGVIKNEVLDLNTLINNVVSMVYCPDNIEIKVAENLPSINANETRIQQLFQNILSNAVNYTDKEVGLIEIKWTENLSHYIFSIKDNGIGIAKKDQKRIFDIFSSLGKHKRSTGVGLNIVKKIVDMYDGEIWLESELGIGTTFFFSIKK
ncbi:PAS domain S-box protein [Saccharicrinis aurantiacus]|uniref:PAS domain S-box protein n=1 Tax=Saccharicrinis aurantiacus TaxID=1849719 RepID=UPI00094FDF55|nr:PAS domain S-box protein [Saccharicrinis aurantiacus]